MRAQWVEYVAGHGVFQQVVKVFTENGISVGDTEGSSGTLIVECGVEKARELLRGAGLLSGRTGVLVWPDDCVGA